MTEEMNSDLWLEQTARLVRNVTDKLKEALRILVLELFESTHKPPLDLSKCLSTTTTTTNHHTTPLGLISPNESGQIGVFQFFAFLNHYLMKMLQDRTLQHLLFLTIEYGAISHKGTPEVFGLMDQISTSREPRRYFSEYTDKLVMLGLGEKFEIRRPDGGHFPGKPVLFKLFCATQAQVEVARLDYFNLRTSGQETKHRPQVPPPQVTNEEALIEASIPQKRSSIDYRKAGQKLIRERIEYYESKTSLSEEDQRILERLKEMVHKTANPEAASPASDGAGSDQKHD